jgi:hypothetical protein
MTFSVVHVSFLKRYCDIYFDPIFGAKGKNLHFSLQDCFEIGKSSGVLTWAGEIPKVTIKNELVQFDVVAYQESNVEKQISRTVIITFPGDKNGVNFTQSEYQASLTWVSIY